MAVPIETNRTLFRRNSKEELIKSWPDWRSMRTIHFPQGKKLPFDLPKGFLSIPRKVWMKC